MILILKKRDKFFLFFGLFVIKEKFGAFDSRFFKKETFKFVALSFALFYVKTSERQSSFILTSPMSLQTSSIVTLSELILYFTTERWSCWRCTSFSYANFTISQGINTLFITFLSRNSFIMQFMRCLQALP